MLMGLSEKDSKAFLAAVILGVASCALIALSAYGAIVTVLFCSVVSPLAVVTMADEKRIGLCLIPNAIVTLWWALFEIISPYGRGFTWEGAVVMGGMAAVIMSPALAVAGLIHLSKRGDK
jgi:uncharacterized membrane protein